MNDPLIGRQLANFRVESVLGRGGMAQVYYGQDVKLQRPVAIKVIDTRYRDQPAYAKRFVNEARVLAKWRHEHIVQIYYADDENGLYYYVMEYIDGQNLASIIASYAVDGELMPVEDVLHIGNAIAGALDYAHKQGVIHRDVKPSNILVARDGRVVLGDFGLAMDLADGSMGETLGTPHYISPEQASRSANAVPQSDLYSLGVILFEMLVGVVPFNDPSPTSVALQHITETPPAPRSINSDLTSKAEKVLLKALEKSPQDRYQSGFELMNALKSALTVKPTKEKTPLPPLPVGVPTIARKSISKESVIRRVASTPIENHAFSQNLEASSKPQKGKRGIKRFSKSWFLFFSLLFLALIIFAWNQGWLRSGEFAKLIPLRPAQPTVTVPLPTNLPTIEVTPTTLPLSNVTLVAALPENTATPLPSPSLTYTTFATNTVLSVSSAEPTRTVNLDGQRFRLYYNENSLYLHNLSNVTRSISGFTFERIDDQGGTRNFFGGWDWGIFYPNILPDRCVAIELYESPPFLKPSECKEPYLSLLNPSRNDGKAFWTSQFNSQEFRVSWQREEVARCTVGTGGCEFFVP